MSIEMPVKLETLKKLGLDPKQYPTCSPYVQGQPGGCRKWAKCKVPKEKRGDPQELGIRLLKVGPGGPLPGVNDIKTCYHVPDMAEPIRLNGGAIKILAYEGEEIPMVVETVTEKMVAGEGLKRFVERSIQKVKVPAFKDNIDLLADAMAAGEIEEIEGQEETERVAELEQSSKSSVAGRRR